MTLYDYKILSEEEQWSTIWRIGKFLDIIEQGNTKFVLYAIDMFFVEVIWDIEKDEIIGKGQFKEGDALIGIVMFLRRFDQITQIRYAQWGFIYEVDHGGHRHYEVFKKRLNRRFATVSYPRSKSFGKWAWTFMTLDKAKYKLAELETTGVLKELESI